MTMKFAHFAYHSQSVGLELQFQSRLHVFTSVVYLVCMFDSMLLMYYCYISCNVFFIHASPN